MSTDPCKRKIPSLLTGLEKLPLAAGWRMNSAPLATTTGLMGFKDPVAPSPTWRIPALTTVEPVYVFAFSRVTLAVPSLIRSVVPPIPVPLSV